MSWKIYCGSKKDWNDQILKSKLHYRQSYNWGEYKSLMSWNVLRLKKVNEDGTVNLIQVTYRKFLSLCAVYIPGNVYGDINFLDKDFGQTLKKITKQKALFDDFAN